MPKNDRYVVKRGTDWAVKKGGVDRPESVHGTQTGAERAAKKTVGSLGGGEVRIQGREMARLGHGGAGPRPVPATR